MKRIVALVLLVLLCLSFASCFGRRGGLSAYEVAVENGYKGDENSWLESLRGKDLTLTEIYSAAKAEGYEGDLLSFLKEYLSYDDGDLVNAGVAPVSAGISGALLSSVIINCSFDYYSYTFHGIPLGIETQQITGGGVIYRLDKEKGDAYIITNYHVVYYASALTEDKISDRIKVYLYGSESERYAMDATYVGGSMNYDIAVLKITGSEFLKNNSALAVAVADSDLLTVGDAAIAIGNPKSGGISVTRGIVSVDSEYITMQACDNVSIVSYRLLRVDTAINSGNSGGGLFSEDGKLIGIVNAKVSSSEVENIGFAIPSNIATNVADNVIDNCDGTTSRKPKICVPGVSLTVSGSQAYFDAETHTTRIRESVYVTKVQSGTPAEGLLKTGDALTAVKIGEKTYRIDRSFVFDDVMPTCRVGDVVTVYFVRDDVPGSVEFTLDASAFVEVK